MTMSIGDIIQNIGDIGLVVWVVWCTGYVLWDSFFGHRG